MTRWAALVAVVALACVVSRRPESSEEAPGSRIGFSRPPVVDGDRTACVQPPYAPAEGATALADGTSVRRDGDAPEWTVVVRDGREPTPSESAALVQRLRDRDDLRFLSHGLYCDGHTRTCFSLAGNLCESTVENLVSRVQTALADEPDSAELRIELHVTLAGRLGARDTIIETKRRLGAGAGVVGMGGRRTSRPRGYGPGKKFRRPCDALGAVPLFLLLALALAAPTPDDRAHTRGPARRPYAAANLARCRRPWETRGCDRVARCARDVPGSYAARRPPHRRGNHRRRAGRVG